MTDAEQRRTVRTYDDLGNLLSENSPATGLTTYEYDSAGNQVSMTDARGVVVNYTYDALNRLVHVDYVGTDDEDVSYEYDDANVPNSVGRLTKVVDESGTRTYRYDARGNTTEEAVVDIATHSVRYGYDAAKRISSITYPGDLLVRYLRNLGKRCRSRYLLRLRLGQSPPP